VRDGREGKLTGATRREIRPPEQKPEGIRRRCRGASAAKATELSGSRDEEKDESPREEKGKRKQSES
jgi:hypothetical protein